MQRGVTGCLFLFLPSDFMARFRPLVVAPARSSSLSEGGLWSAPGLVDPPRPGRSISCDGGGSLPDGGGSAGGGGGSTGGGGGGFSGGGGGGSSGGGATCSTTRQAGTIARECR